MTPEERFESQPRPLGIGRRALRALARLIVPPYAPRRSPTSKVAIVVPLSSRPELHEDEEISLRHLCHFLGRYDKFLLVPRGMPIQRQGFTTVHFPKKFFGSAAAHGRMAYWPNYYKTFEQYEFILVYHPDALVFSDDLLQWCEAGWDFIGAPWVPCEDSPWITEPAVGNGGFALMKVESCLRVLATRHREEPLKYLADLLAFNGRYLGPLFSVLTALKRVLPRSRVVNWPLARWHEMENPEIYSLNNDVFWAFSARRYFPDFKVATVEDALRFSFEACPRKCFEMNNRRLPFGCHAWARYDRAFWEPHLLSPSAMKDVREPQRSQSASGSNGR